MPLKKLTCTNNWENLTYRWGGVEVTKISFVTVVDDEGVSHTLPAKFVEERRSYNDMGHTYSTTTKVLYVKWALLGIWVKVERDEALNKIEGISPRPKES